MLLTLDVDFTTERELPCLKPWHSGAGGRAGLLLGAGGRAGLLLGAGGRAGLLLGAGGRAGLPLGAGGRAGLLLGAGGPHCRRTSPLDFHIQ